ncbi:hypothetical protein GCM10023322_68660 [Rugosimonospora acidiphila]|uniref:Type II secretion system protein GspF domain-containing protein n=1 Tax=Rugosimonospora acidiphila TaxID=556531 RepID=A0ABP9SJB3_9ACTN
MIWTILFGAGTGLALWLALDAVLPAQPRLGVVVAALNTTTVTAPAAPVGTGRPVPGWLARPLGPALRLLGRAGLPRPATLRDLALLDRDPAGYLAVQLGTAVAGLAAPALLSTLAAAAAGIQVNLELPLWAGLCAAAAGALLPQVALRAQAAKRRVELRHALSTLLDLVVICLAGGAGVEQALHDASRPILGSSWGMRRLRGAIEAAHRAQVAPWRTLGQLGADTGVRQLQELAAAVMRAGRDGAPVGPSLTARADTLRTRQAADLKAHAKAANQRMVLPIMLMALAYVIFLFYPAVEAISAGL